MPRPKMVERGAIFATVRGKRVMVEGPKFAPELPHSAETRAKMKRTARALADDRIGMLAHGARIPRAAAARVLAYLDAPPAKK